MENMGIFENKIYIFHHNKLKKHLINTKRKYCCKRHYFFLLHFLKNNIQCICKLQVFKTLLYKFSFKVFSFNWVILFLELFKKTLWFTSVLFFLFYAMAKKLFVGNINWSASKEDLENIFGEYGELEEVVLLKMKTEDQKVSDSFSM